MFEGTPMTGAASCLNGHPIKSGDRFCATCGAPVSAAAPPPPPGDASASAVAEVPHDWATAVG